MIKVYCICICFQFLSGYVLQYKCLLAYLRYMSYLKCSKSSHRFIIIPSSCSGIQPRQTKLFNCEWGCNGRIENSWYKVWVLPQWHKHIVPSRILPSVNNRPADKPPKKAFPAPISELVRKNNQKYNHERPACDIHDLSQITLLPECVNPESRIPSLCHVGTKCPTSDNHISCSAYASIEFEKLRTCPLNQFLSWGVIRLSQQRKGFFCIGTKVPLHEPISGFNIKFYLSTDISGSTFINEGSSSGMHLS